MHNDTSAHPLDRRNFLKVSGALALLVGLGGSRGALASSGLARPPGLAGLHLADFEATLGQSFRVYGAAADPYTVTLAAVKNRAAMPAAHPNQEWFSLAFCGPKGQTFPQGSYTFAHPRLGRFELFVVPAMAVEHEERHIAIINRI